MKKQPEWLNQEQMARSCGVSRSAFQKWDVSPVAKIGRYSFYRVADVLENRLAQQAKQHVKEVATLSDPEFPQTEREEKLRLISAQADGQEIKNEQLRKELAPVGVIEWVVGKAGAHISSILGALPLHLKKRNPKLTAANIETIKREIVKAQNAAAKMTVDLDEFYGSNTD